MTTLSSTPAIKTCNIGDDLRLPCFVEAQDTAPLMKELEFLRKTSAPIPFQSKHLPALKRNVWYACKRPADRSRSGLLCVWPRHGCCVYITGGTQHVRTVLLRLRVDPQFLIPGVGMTVFAATLSPNARRIWMEDVLVWKGRPVLEEEPFSVRWEKVVQWTDHYCIADSALLNGVEVECAPWESLDAVNAYGVWDLQCEEAGRRRCFWIANRRDAYITPKPSTTNLADMTTEANSIVHIHTQTIQESETEEPMALVALASKGMGPDQWILRSADGVSLGAALIRTLRISSELRESSDVTVPLEVAWNTNFDKWEVKQILSGRTTASHSLRFEQEKSPA